MILLLSVCSIGFLIYGALVVSGIYTPISSKILVEDEERAKWCHTEESQRCSGGWIWHSLSCTDAAYFRQFYGLRHFLY